MSCMTSWLIFFKEISTFLVVGCLPVSIGACAPWLLCTANVQLPRGSSALWVGIRWGFLVQLDKSYLQKVKSTSGLHFSMAKKRLIKTWPCPISLSDLDSNIFWPQCVWNSQALRSRVLWGTLRFFWMRLPKDVRISRDSQLRQSRQLAESWKKTSYIPQGPMALRPLKLESGNKCQQLG